MSKLKELLDKYAYQTGGVYSLIDIEELCKEYAALCLEKAAEEAEIMFYDDGPGDFCIDKESITNIELP